MARAITLAELGKFLRERKLELRLQFQRGRYVADAYDHMGLLVASAWACGSSDDRDAMTAIKKLMEEVRESV